MAHPPPGTTGKHPFSRWEIGGVVLVLTMNLVCIGWTWRYCPDPAIDFGREIYIPWQIADGKVLYRDLNYFDGPLGVYGMAAAFKVFGASLAVVKAFNAVVVLATAMLVWWLIRAISDAWAATVAGITFAVAFATQQFTWDASFNWLTPYSLNLTWGIALSLGMIGCLWRATTRGRIGWLVGAGVLLGLVALTKAEVTLAAVVAAGAGIGCAAWGYGWDRRRTGRAVGVFAACAAAPLIVAFVLLWLTMPCGEALAGLAGAWKFLSNRALLGMTYFRWIAGIDNPEKNFLDMLLFAGRYGLILVPALAVAWLLRGRARNVMAAGAGVVAVGAATLTWFASSGVAWVHVTRPLPLFLVVILGGLMLSILQRREDAARLMLPLCFTVFAGLLLAKIPLRVNLTHYGFALAMPGTMLLIAALVGWVPRQAGRDGAVRWIPRAAVLGAWAVVMIGLLQITQAQMRPRVHPIGDGGDRFFADDRGALMEAARKYLQQHAAPGDTLVCVPEGSILNYLARLPSPIRFHNFLPPEIAMFGERLKLAALESSPPDWIVLMHTDTSIYDARFFGIDYARGIAAWIDRTYDLVETVGLTEVHGMEFGVAVLKRKAAPDAPRAN